MEFQPTKPNTHDDSPCGKELDKSDYPSRLREISDKMASTNKGGGLTLEQIRKKLAIVRGA